MWLKLIDVLSTKLIYHKGGLIFYIKKVIDDEIVVFVKMVYIVSIGQYIVSEELYHLKRDMTLKRLILIYKELIDDYNLISKK